MLLLICKVCRERNMLFPTLVLFTFFCVFKKIEFIVSIKIKKSNTFRKSCFMEVFII